MEKASAHGKQARELGGQVIRFRPTLEGIRGVWVHLPSPGALECAVVPGHTHLHTHPRPHCEALDQCAVEIECLVFTTWTVVCVAVQQACARQAYSECEPHHKPESRCTDSGVPCCNKDFSSPRLFYAFCASPEPPKNRGRKSQEPARMRSLMLHCQSFSSLFCHC